MIRFPGIGGIETVTRLIAEELNCSYGVNITILSFLQQGELSFPYAEVKCMPNSKDWLAKENYDYAEKIIKEGCFDYIIYQDSYARTESILFKLAAKYGIKVCVFEHNTPLYLLKYSDYPTIFSIAGIKKRLARLYFILKSIQRKRFLLKKSYKYILLSKKFIPEFTCYTLNCRQNPKVTFINNPVKYSVWKPKAKEKTILCVCQLDKRKRVDLMLDIWSSVCRNLGNWKFQIVGDGIERKKLEQMVVEHKIPRVEFIGFADPTVYYRKAAIFWMTSSFEGWGMTLVESMQNACIPIAYNTYSSLTDIIDDGKNGFIVNNKDKKTFIDRTLLIANDETLKKQMQEKCLEKAVCFDVKNIAKKWAELLQINVSA